MSTATVECKKCGKQFEVKTKYFRIFGDDPYCPDCLIHTTCNRCDKGLRLKPSRYQELGGDPIYCTDCADQAKSTTQANTTSGSTSGGDSLLSGTFWEGLTFGEKSVFPVLLALNIIVFGYFGWAAYRGVEIDAGVIPAGLFFLLLWTYYRGRKNR